MMSRVLMYRFVYTLFIILSYTHFNATHNDY